MERRRGSSESQGHGLSGEWNLPTRLLLLISGSLLCILSTSACVAQQSAKNVLFIFSSFDQQRRFLEPFENALRARTPHHLNIYTSHVDYERMGDASYRESLAETFHNA